MRCYIKKNHLETNETIRAKINTQKYQCKININFWLD